MHTIKVSGTIKRTVGEHGSVVHSLVGVHGSLLEMRLEVGMVVELSITVLSLLHLVGTEVHMRIGEMIFIFGSRQDRNFAVSVTKFYSVFSGIIIKEEFLSCDLGLFLLRKIQIKISNTKMITRVAISTRA